MCKYNQLIHDYNNSCVMVNNQLLNDLQSSCFVVINLAVSRPSNQLFHDKKICWFSFFESASQSAVSRSTNQLYHQYVLSRSTNISAISLSIIQFFAGANQLFECNQSAISYSANQLY